MLKLALTKVCILNKIGVIHLELNTRTHIYLEIWQGVSTGNQVISDYE